MIWHHIQDFISKSYSKKHLAAQLLVETWWTRHLLCPKLSLPDFFFFPSTPEAETEQVWSTSYIPLASY